MPYFGLPLSALELGGVSAQELRSLLHPLTRSERLARVWSLSLAKKLKRPSAASVLGKLPALEPFARRFLGRMDRMCVQVCGAPFRLDVLRRSVSRSVYLGGRWHAGVAAMVRGHVRPGTTAADLGANVGWMSMQMAEVAGPEGTVLSFEPEPKNFSLLTLNARHARWRNVIPFQVAIGEEVGEADLWISTTDGGDHRTGPALLDRPSLRVPVTTLDHVAAERRTHIHFVKLDIQGAEGRALRGMHDTLRSPHLHGVVLEFWPEALVATGEDPTEVLALLHDAGLRCASAPRIDTDARGFVRDIPAGGWTDLLFLRP